MLTCIHPERVLEECKRVPADKSASPFKEKRNPNNLENQSSFERVAALEREKKKSF